MISPEYQNFFGTTAYGNETLLRIVFDVSPASIKTLRKEQWINILPYLPKYSFSKLNILEYFFEKKSIIYDRASFNQYGDVNAHWGLPANKIVSAGTITGNFNDKLIDELKKIEYKVAAAKATLYITFPCIDGGTFNNNTSQIAKVEAQLRKNNFTLLGTPERYRMPDSLIFFAPYHLTKQGMDIRSRLLIEDIRKAK